MDIIVSVLSTDWGWVGTAASSEGIVSITLPQDSRQAALALLLLEWPQAREGTDARLEALHAKLQRYFRGGPVTFDEQVLDTRRATRFQQHVWEVVRAIPRGQVRSYGWVANAVGSPKAARAVGRAMATNPLPIVVPCHRVVGQAGQLIGFGGGLDMKRRLLDMEAGEP